MSDMDEVLERLEFEGTAFGSTYFDPAKQKWDAPKRDNWGNVIKHPHLCKGWALECRERAGEDGLCDGCRQAGQEWDDWNEAREQASEEMLEGNGYD